MLITFLVLLCSLSVSCGTSKQSASSMAAESGDSSRSLSRQDRIEIFEDVWKTINEQYYDPSFNGVDWQAVHVSYLPKVEATKTDLELYRLLEEMVALLKDAHTVFRHPLSDGERINPPGSVGISLGEVEGETVITEVEPDSDAARAGVKPGMILRSVNGEPVDELYQKISSQFAGSSTEQSMKSVMHAALLYGGFLGASRTFGVQDFDGKAFDFSVAHFGARPSEIPILSARRLPSNIGYIKFDVWKPPVDEQFKAELAKLMDTAALILDLRDNGGGQTEILLNIGSVLFPAETNFGSFKRRGGPPEQIVTRKSDEVYKGKVVILVNEVSASASEVFAAALQELGRARVIGQRTCGCVLNRQDKNVKGGGTLGWSARIYASPKNRVLEGTGVTPDEIVALKISDLREGRDAALEAAERSLARH